MLAALLLSWLVVQAIPPAPPTAVPQEYPSIKNFLRINSEICTGGQPAMEDLARMKAEGVRAILNLRRPSEYNAEEEALKAKELGLRYFNIPVNGAEPRDEQADEFLKLIADLLNRPIFIHCTSANRVGAFWMVRRVLIDHWKLDDAEAEARKMGLHSQNLVDFARSYIARHSKPQQPAS